MSDRANYIRFLKEACGVDAVLWSAPPSVLEPRIFHTETGHFPAPGPKDLLVLHEGEGLFKGETAELWAKMRAAMRLEGRTILEIEVFSPRTPRAVQELLETYPCSHLLILTPTPRREKPVTLGVTQVFETYSPGVLLERAELKKSAWADLQEIMKGLNLGH